MTKTTTTRTDYIIIDHTHVYWPGRLPFRDQSSRVGYASEEIALRRASRIRAHFAGKFGGTGCGELSVVERTRTEAAHYVSGTRLTGTHLASELDDCGHRHRTAETAHRCQREHARGCASQGGYSQRAVYAVADGMAESCRATMTAQTVTPDYDATLYRCTLHDEGPDGGGCPTIGEPWPGSEQLIRAGTAADALAETLARGVSQVEDLSEYAGLTIVAVVESEYGGAVHQDYTVIAAAAS